MITEETGKKLVKFARKTMEQHLANNDPPSTEELSEECEEKRGVFVTINTHPQDMLRGCIGVPYPVKKLKDAIVDAAQSTTRDPRFPRLREDELDTITVEVTILTKPEKIEEDPKNYPSSINIGRDGLIIEAGVNRGLLLPQVPVERNWDEEEFLSQTCIKAGLTPDAWLNKETKIFKFQGQVFGETKPKGRVERKF